MLIISILKEYNQLQEKPEKLQWRSNKIADLVFTILFTKFRGH